MQRKFDLVVLGATGFTGGLICDYIESLKAENVSSLRLALAGRNVQKLDEMRDHRLSKPWDTIVVDLEDEKSIDQMAASTKVILNTAANFINYGPKVVKSAIKHSTHYIDSAGEYGNTKSVEFILDMYKLHDLARLKQCWIVPGCGYNSVPADLTVFAAMQQLTREEKENAKITTKVYSFVQNYGNISGGTFGNFIETLGRTIPNLRRHDLKIDAGTLHSLQPGGYALPIPSSDPVVVGRSAQLLRIPDASKSITAQNATFYYPKMYKGEVYAVIPSLLIALLLVVGIAIAFLVSQVGVGRCLLKRVIPSGTGPNAASRRRSYFNTVCEMEVPASSQVSRPRLVVATMRGGDPYSETGKMMVESALSILLDKLPRFETSQPSDPSRTASAPEGGVVSPAVTFGPVLLKRLHDAGIPGRLLAFSPAK